MRIQTSNSGAPVPQGEHVFVLTSVEVKRLASQFSKSSDGMDDRLMWLFVTESTERYEYPVFTGLSYGSDKATMTSLLDQLCPGMTVAQAAELDTDSLIGKRFRARIVHKTNSTTGKIVAQHLFIEPLCDSETASTAPTEPTVPADDGADADPAEDITW